MSDAKTYKKVFIWHTEHVKKTGKRFGNGNSGWSVNEDDGSEDGGEPIADFKYKEHAEAFAASIADEVEPFDES